MRRSAQGRTPASSKIAWPQIDIRTKSYNFWYGDYLVHEIKILIVSVRWAVSWHACLLVVLIGSCYPSCRASVRDCHRRDPLEGCGKHLTSFWSLVLTFTSRSRRNSKYKRKREDTQEAKTARWGYHSFWRTIFVISKFQVTQICYQRLLAFLVFKLSHEVLKMVTFGEIVIEIEF